MAHSKDLVDQAVQGIEASRTTSATAAGHASHKTAQGTNPGTTGEGRTPPAESGRTPPTEELIDAINQVFALFRLNYHNQFYAAYPDSEQLNQVKKLWLDSLRDFPVEQILSGAKRAIETGEYLPTLNRMLECCRDSVEAYGLPDARAAYLEACAAGSPKSAQPWSHPAVYFAGREADWFVLAGEPEAKTWPVFRDAYRRWCARVMAGEELIIDAPEALPESSGKTSSKAEALAELEKIRERLD